LFVALLALLAIVGCDRQQASSSASGPSMVVVPTVKLQLNWKPEPQFGGFYAAKDVAAKNDLNVDVVAGGVGTPTVQMVAAGKTEFAVVSADEVVIARSNGADVVALFAVYQTNPQGLMTHAARGLNQIGDIFTQPGTLAIQRGLPYASFLEKKYSFEKLKVVPSPGGDLSAFRSDPNFTMQCFVTSEPIAARKAELDPKTFLIADAGYNPYTTVLVTRGDYLKSNRKIVQAMVAAVAQGWRDYLDNPSTTNAKMHQLNPTMDADTFNAAADAQKPLIETPETKQSGLGHMTAARWQELCDQLVDLKVIEKAPPAASCFALVATPTTKP
jgi:NitT/TauT family transport system substrate-binding protein